MSSPAPGVALVTGGGSGIGRAVAEALAPLGYDLALVGRRRAPLDAVIAATGGRGLAVAADVRDARALEQVAAEVERVLGPVAVAVPAAGVARVAPFLELGAEAFAETVATNLLGAAHLFRACLPAMLGRGRGHLVPILSVAARKGFPSWTAYCASKWGLAGLIEALREELRGSGVRLSTIVPGATASGLWESVPGRWDRGAMIPVAEVARAVVWVLAAGEGVAVEEVRLQPPRGDL